jgi:uncharacterized lipoprotein YmbA
MIKNILLVLSLSALLAGCSSAPTQFYMLESVSKNTPVRQINKSHTFGVGPLSLPTIVDRLQIVTRTAKNEVKLAEFDQWAAPLTETIILVISQNLTALQPASIFRQFPWSAYGTVDYRVIIDINRLDIRPGQSVTFEASFAIMDENNRSITRNARFKSERPLPDKSYAEIVKTLSRILGDFSERISLAIKQI